MTELASVLWPGSFLLAGLGWLWWLRRRLLVVTVRGPSMAPTYREGDRLLVRRRSGRLVRPGEVVVLETPLYAGPAADGGRVVKRVVAVAGDPVPPGVPAGVPAAEPLVPPGKLVLLGDNRAFSTDSRHHGYFEAEDVVGVAVRLMASGRSGP